MNDSTRIALEAALSALDSARAAVSAALAQPIETGPSLVDAKAALREYGIGRDGLLSACKRGELELHRGARGRILVERAALEAWIRSRPVRPRVRSFEAANDDLEAWAASELAAITGAQ